MKIREATVSDFELIWPMFKEVATAGETYAFDTDISKKDAQQIWIETPAKTFVVQESGEILGTYYLKTNHQGPGNHVCNCGYIVSSAARGRGLATTMCKHSQVIARDLGYKAMQFNFVASSNTGAIRLWKTLGYEIVGQLPKAFKHPKQGLIDALVMYKWL